MYRAIPERPRSGRRARRAPIPTTFTSTPISYRDPRFHADHRSGHYHLAPRRRPGSRLVGLFSWALVGVMLVTGMGITLNPVPTGVDGLAQWERGILLPDGPNLYRLSLCEQEEARFPLTNGDLVLINPRSTDPQVGQLAILVGSQTLVVNSGHAGEALLSFEAALVDAQDRVGSSQTLSIRLHVSQCGAPQPDQDDDPGVGDPDPVSPPASGGSPTAELISTPPTGHLLYLGDGNYLLGACRGLRYNYDFDVTTLVRQVTSYNNRVATLTPYTQPTRLMLITQGPGTTLLSFQAATLEHPDDNLRWRSYTIQVTVNRCSAAESASQTTHEVLSLGTGSTSGQGTGSSTTGTGTSGSGGSAGGSAGGVTGTIGGAGSGTGGTGGGGGGGASVIGGGSAAISQALQAGGVTFTGDHDESLGTTHDDGTAFAAHVEMNQGDMTTAFVRLSNQGMGDIAYVLSIHGISGYSVSATPSGDIASIARTGAYSWKFLLPGGPTGADTGVQLTFAIPDAAPTGFYSLGSITIRPVNY